LLIATTLLSLIIYLGGFAYSMFSKGWVNRLDSFNSTAIYTRNLLLFRNVIQGTIPLVVKGKKSEEVIFFHGHGRSIFGVSVNGIFDSSSAVIFKIEYLEEEKTLNYSEVTTNDILVLDFEPSIEFERTITLMKDLENVWFTYYGWPDLESKQQVNQYGKESDKRTWSESYAGDVTRMLPETVQVEFKMQSIPKSAMVFSLSQAAEYVLSRSNSVVE